ncbi:MAG: AraC family transcriptional regulator [Deltaproteobacteria bacterium]|nr:AraC family transcriptional regulator [Deltaproteobacteria bacterium]
MNRTSYKVKANSDVQTAVFSCPGLTLCRFRCPTDHERWRRENLIQDGHNIAFSEVPVEIRHAGQPAILANPTVALYYNHGDPFQRRPLHPVGDSGNIFLFDTQTLLQALTPHEPGANPDRPLSIRVGPVASGTYFKQRMLLATVERRPDEDPDWVLEQALEILQEVLASGYGSQGCRSSLGRRSRERVEAVKDRLALDWHEPLSLAQLAAEVETSVFHLCRSFKRCTGVTVNTYRQFLRLRAGLVQLERPETSLAALALDLGFSHQSHFTEAFRRTFGAPPGKIRKALRSP